MKTTDRAPDPLGTRPAPLSGDLARRFLDDGLRRRSAAALTACEAIWIDHDPQKIIIAQIRAYLEAWSLSEDRASSGGRRLSQSSQAGKSATMRRLRRELAEMRSELGLPENDFQVVIVTLKKRLTLMQLYRAILEKIGDPHHAQEPVGIDTLLQRIKEHSALVGLELLIIDEVQHLDNTSRDATQILDQLKTFVDEALFPIVFVGDEDSEGFFERNGKFAARLGDPLELRRLVPLVNDEIGVADAILFKKFCHEFDKALVRTGALRRRAGLKEAVLLNGLIFASGGHVGRVARILQVAVPHSVWRGADTLDAYDLSHAVRSYAIKNKWVTTDPYSSLA